MPDLCTLDQVLAWAYGARASAVSVDDQAVLQRMISAATAGVLQFLSRPIFEETFVERRTGSGGSSLVLKHYPVTAVGSLSIAGRAFVESTSPSMVGYILNEDVLTLVGDVFPRQPPLAVVVTYTAGYPEDEIPADIVDATIRWVTLRWRERERVGVTTEILEGQNVTYSTRDMPADIQRILTPYQRVVPV